MTYDPWGDFDQAQQEASNGGGGSFAPLPAGARDFNLFEAEIVPYTSKPGSAYAGLYALKVQLKVPDGEDFANRRLFPRVPLFPKSPPAGPNAKEPGAQYVQYDFFNFFQKSLGWDADKLKQFAGKIKSGDIAGATAMVKPELGKRVNATLKITPADEYNPEGGNEVKAWGSASGAKPASNAAADAWAAAKPTAPAASSAADPWGAPAEDKGLAAAAASSSGF